MGPPSGGDAIPWFVLVTGGTIPELVGRFSRDDVSW